VIQAVFPALLRRIPRPGRALAAGTVLAVLAAWGAPGVMPGRAAASVRLNAREFTFAPKTFEAPSGDVTFVVKNDGAIEHNFIAETQAKQKVAEIAVLEPGQSLAVTATLQPGTYTFYCSLPGHRDAGMEGSVTVR
jgi:uncharacterized cupredoxin-like copper-binding protein